MTAEDQAAALRGPSQSLHGPWGTAALVGLVCLLVWAPLPLASNRPWATALLSLLCTALLVVCAWALWLRAKPGTGASRGGPLGAWHFGIALPVLAFSALVFAQFQAGLLEEGHLLGSLDPASTAFYWLASVCHLSALLLVLLVANNVPRVTAVLAAIVASGVLQACVAVAILANGNPFLLFFAELGGGGRATGTFRNADHLAGYLELCLAAGFGLLVAQFSSAGNQATVGWQGKFKLVLGFLLSRKMVLRLTLVMLVIALVLTRSRMGNAAFMFGLMVAAGTLALRSKRLRKPALWLVVSILVIDVIVVGQWVGLDKVVQRLKDTAESTSAQMKSPNQSTAGAQQVFAVEKPDRGEESLQERTLIARLSLSLVEQRPWLGAGGASYYLTLPRIKPAGHYLLWDHAHNDYVEIAVDTGLVGLALLLVVGLATGWRAVRMMSDRQTPLNRGVGTSALMALVCLGVHSLVDFNLQIPANAMTFTVLLALAWAMPLAENRPSRKQPQPFEQAPRAMAGGTKRPSALWGFGGAMRLAFAIACTALAALTAAQAWPKMKADFGTQAARRDITSCTTQGKNWPDARWAELQADMRAGIDTTPDDASLRAQMAQLYSCEGVSHWSDVNRRRASFAKAEQELQVALRLRPDHAQSWGALAVALYALEAPATEVNQGWEVAIDIGQNEMAVRESMFDLALRMWPAASPTMKGWVMQRYQAASKEERLNMVNLAKQLGRSEVFNNLPAAQ